MESVLVEQLTHKEECPPVRHAAHPQRSSSTVIEHAHGRCHACAGERLSHPLQPLFSPPIAARVDAARPTDAHRVPIDLVFHELPLLERVRNVLRDALPLQHDAIYPGRPDIEVT